MQRFKSSDQAQDFLSAHAIIYGHFRPRRHRLSADGYRHRSHDDQDQHGQSRLQHAQARVSAEMLRLLISLELTGPSIWRAQYCRDPAAKCNRSLTTDPSNIRRVR